MCYRCKSNINRKKEGLDILVRCTQGKHRIYCTDSQYDSKIQTLISLIPGIALDLKKEIAWDILQYRAEYFENINEDYPISQYITDIHDYVSLFNSIHAKANELQSIVILLHKNKRVRDGYSKILSKIRVSKRNYTRFFNMYQWMNSGLYKLIKKILVF